MNLVQAYTINSRALHEIRYGGRLSITHDLLLRILELPDMLRIRAIYPDYTRNCLDIILESNYAVPGITYPVVEGASIPHTDIQLLTIINTEATPPPPLDMERNMISYSGREPIPETGTPTPSTLAEDLANLFR